MIWIWLLLALVPMVIVGSGLALCLPYRRSPEKRWRDSVLRAYQAAQRQVHYEQAERQRLINRQRDESQSLSQKAFERFLASISVHELEAYPGIGPATVGRLKQAGYENLARLQNARIRVHGLGQKRLNDVDGAVRQLKRQAESRFQAGACPESQQLAAQLQELEPRYAELDCRARARAKGATEVVRQLEKSVVIAQQVSFWKYFWKDAQVVVPPELLHRALPDLRAAVTNAEQYVLKTSRGHEATGNDRAGSKSRTVVPVAEALPVPNAVPVARPVATPQPTKPNASPTTADPQRSSGLDARALLEINPSVQLTADLIRRQYHLLSSRLQPEKLESMGPEFVAMAHTKRQTIRAAAETLIQPLGEPLDLPTRPEAPTELRHNPDLDAMFGA